MMRVVIVRSVWMVWVVRMVRMVRVVRMMCVSLRVVAVPPKRQSPVVTPFEPLLALQRLFQNTNQLGPCHLISYFAGGNIRGPSAHAFTLATIGVDVGPGNDARGRRSDRRASGRAGA